MLTALLPFIFALLWASSYVAAKVGLVDATPFALVGVRLSIAAVAAGLLIAATGRSWPRLKSWPQLLLGGALLHGLGLSMTHAALIVVDATPTALVHAFHPILTAALAITVAGTASSWSPALFGTNPAPPAAQPAAPRPHHNCGYSTDPPRQGQAKPGWRRRRPHTPTARVSRQRFPL